MIQAKKYLFAFVAFVATCGPLGAQPRVFTLDELLSVADTCSAPLRASRLSADASRAEQEAVDRRVLTPDVRLDAAVGYLGNGHGWGRDSSYSFTVPMPHFSTRFGVEAQQVVFSGGAARAARQQAAQGARLASLDAAQRRQEVRLQLVGLYLDLFRLQCQASVLDSNVARTRRLVDDIRALHESGVALKNDLTRNELRLSELLQQRASVADELRVVGRQAATLAGLDPTAVVLPDSSFLHALPQPALYVDSLALSLQVAQAQVALAEARLRQSRASLWPSLAVVAQDRLEGPVTIDITPYDINYNYWFVGLSLNYNLSALWKSRSGVRAERLRLEESRLRRQYAADVHRSERDAASIRLAEAERRCATRRQSVALARENYELVYLRYLSDVARLIDLLDAADVRLRAELDLVSARADVAYQHYVLQYVAGRL
ncbi:MAG: TolC family protein [Bacteroidales bacterium]|nr:TolC family protein [Bacteroidales bacterium]